MGPLRLPLKASFQGSTRGEYTGNCKDYLGRRLLGFWELDLRFGVVLFASSCRVRVLTV